MMPSVNKGEESELYLKSFLLREKTQNRKDTIFGKIIQLSDNGNLSELVWDEDADKYLENKNVGKLKSISFTIWLIVRTSVLLFVPIF